MGLTAVTSTHSHYCHFNGYFRALLSVLVEESRKDKLTKQCHERMLRMKMSQEVLLKFLTKIRIDFLNSDPHFRALGLFFNLKADIWPEGLKTWIVDSF